LLYRPFVNNPAKPIKQFLSSCDWYYGHETGPLYGFGQFVLMPAARAASLWRYYFGVSRNEFTQELRIFIVYSFYILRTKKARLWFVSWFHGFRIWKSHFL